MVCSYSMLCTSQSVFDDGVLHASWYCCWIADFAQDSDNHVIENPQLLTKMLEPVKRAHRRVSRRQIGGSHHRKARHMLARLYEKINNRRKDFLHKTPSYYSSRYDLIFLERLKVLNMTKNHKTCEKNTGCQL